MKLGEKPSGDSKMVLDFLDPSAEKMLSAELAESAVSQKSSVTHARTNQYDINRISTSFSIEQGSIFEAPGCSTSYSEPPQNGQHSQTRSVFAVPQLPSTSSSKPKTSTFTRPLDHFRRTPPVRNKTPLKRKSTFEETQSKLRYSLAETQKNMENWTPGKDLDETKLRTDLIRNFYNTKAEIYMKGNHLQESSSIVKAEPNGIKTEPILEEPVTNHKEDIANPSVIEEQVIVDGVVEDPLAGYLTDAGSTVSQLPYVDWGEKQWKAVKKLTASPFRAEATDNSTEWSSFIGRIQPCEISKTPIETVDEIGKHFERAFDKITIQFYAQQVIYDETELDSFKDAFIEIILDSEKPIVRLKLANGIADEFDVSLISKIAMVPSLMPNFPPCLILTSGGLDDWIANISEKFRRLEGQPKCQQKTLFFVLGTHKEHIDSQCKVQVQAENSNKTYRISASAGFEVLDSHVQLNLALHPKLSSSRITFKFLLDNTFWDYILHLRIIWISLVNRNGKIGWIAKCREDLETECDSGFLEMHVETGHAFSLYPPTHKYRPLQRISKDSYDKKCGCREPFLLKFRDYSTINEDEQYEGDEGELYEDPATYDNSMVIEESIVNMAPETNGSDQIHYDNSLPSTSRTNIANFPWSGQESFIPLLTGSWHQNLVPQWNIPSTSSSIYPQPRNEQKPKKRVRISSETEVFYPDQPHQEHTNGFQMKEYRRS